MPRKRRLQPQPTPTPAPIISLRAVYTMKTAAQTLGLDDYTLPNEIRKGRISRARRVGRVYFLGKWLIEWIEAGEMTRRKPAPGAAGPTGLQTLLDAWDKADPDDRAAFLAEVSPEEALEGLPPEPKTSGQKPGRK